MSMRSVIIKGYTDSDGTVSGSINNLKNLNTNTWEYRFSSIHITALKSNFDILIELACSLNCSNQYDYELERVLCRPTPYCVINCKGKKHKGQLFDLSTNFLWLPIEDARESIKIVLSYAGTSHGVEEAVEIVAHLCIQRRE